MKHGDKIREKILNAGVEIWPDVTPSNIAKIAKLKSHSVVLYHFKSDELKNAVAEHAVNIGNSRVIVQLIAMKHKAVKKLNVRERNKHFKGV